MSRLWLEIWTRPGDPNYGRVIDDPLEVEGDFHAGLNQIGNGGMQLSNRSPYFNQILKSDPDTASNSRSSTAKIFSEEDPTTPIFEWLPNQLFPSTSKNDPLVQVSGLGINALPAHARLEPYDWDGTDDFIPSQPDWEWGAANILGNGDFENNTVTPQVYQLTITATGGTYTISDGTDTTSAIAYNAIAATIETRLQTDIAAITDLIVVGTGGGVFDIQFVTPPFGIALTVNTGSLTGGTATLDETQEGGLTPNPWTRAGAIIQGVNMNTAGGYDAWEVSDAQNHTPGGTYSLLVNPGPTTATSNRQGGAQQVVSVTPGAIYQASIWIYPTSGTNAYQLQIRGMGSERIAQSATLSFTANTWNQITISDIFIPEGNSQVVFRLSNMDPGPSDPAAFYLDDAEFYPGFAPTTIGEILRLIYEHATDVTLRDPIVWDDGSGTDTPYLTLDFSDTLDSNGVAWADAEIKTKLTMRMSYSQIMASLARDFGYEYRIVADNVETGTYHWQVYNPGSMQTDYTTAASPGIAGGANDVRRNVNRFLPSGTDTMVEGLGRVTARARDTALMTALGRIESSRLNREAPDLGAAAEAADESIANLLTNSRSLNYILVDPPDEPMSAYTIGDLLVVDDPPEVVASPARFVDVTCSFTPNQTEWEVQFGSTRIMNPDAAVASAVGGLLAKFEYPFPEPTTLNISPGGGGGEFTVQVAASNASDLAKSKADFICTGTADQDAIQTANGLLTAGGKIVLSEGTFILSDAFTLSNNVQLTGTGIFASVLRYTGTSDPIINPGTYNTFSDFGFTFVGAAGGITCIGRNTGTTVQRVGFDNTGALTNIALEPGDFNSISDCWSEMGWLVFATDRYRYVSVTNNRIGTGLIEMSNPELWEVTGNMIGSGQIVGGDGIRTVIADNTIDQASDDTRGMVFGFSGVAEGCVISGNNSWTGALTGVRLGTGSYACVVDGNNITDPIIGIDLEGVDGCVVTGNSLRFAGQHGIRLDDSSDNHVSDNHIYGPSQNAANTYDGIFLEGDSDLNDIFDNRVLVRGFGGPARYGINISAATCNDNAYLGNRTGPTAGYGTAAYNDAGTGTVNVWPGAAAPQGDNLL